MTIDEPLSTPVPRRAPGGMLVAWWREGMRTAFMKAPRWEHLHATPAILAGLVAAPACIAIAGERLYIAGSADFAWPALLGGWLALMLPLWACWLVAHGRKATDDEPEAGTASLFAMFNAQGLTILSVMFAVYIPIVRFNLLQQVPGETVVRWALMGTFLAWFALAQTLLLWRNALTPRPVRALACAVLIASLVVHDLLAPPRFHWQASRDESEEAQPATLQLTQEVLEAQPRVLQARLDGLKPQRPGVIDLFALTFAPYASEDVFRRESELVAGVMSRRFDAEGRTLQLVNHPQTAHQWPWATPLNLRRAIERAARLMDRDEDVLFIHLTSHGAANGTLSAWFWPLEVEEVTPAMLRQWLDDAGVRHRIVSVSACFSGSWIAPLSDEGTLVMTAADSEHTSYGCGHKSELTFFGRAMYDEQLRQTWSFEKAHAAARGVIERREKEAGKTDGYSNPQIFVGPRIRRVLEHLESHRSSAAAR